MTGEEIIYAAFARFQAIQVGGSEQTVQRGGFWHVAPLDLQQQQQQQLWYVLPVVALHRGNIHAFTCIFVVDCFFFFQTIKVHKESGLCKMSWGFLAL